MFRVYKNNSFIRQTCDSNNRDQSTNNNLETQCNSNVYFPTTGELADMQEIFQNIGKYYIGKKYLNIKKLQVKIPYDFGGVYNKIISTFLYWC